VAAARQDLPRVIGVHRSLAALRELAAHPKGIGLDHLAARLQQPKSSTHRALAALRRAGFVEKDDNRRYHLTLEFVRLAFAYYDALDHQALVQPVLDLLAAQFEETAHYAVLDEGDVIYLARAAPPQVFFQMAATVGGRQPAHSTALGKMLLAYALPDGTAVDRFVDAHNPLAKKTPRTLTTAKALASELETTRNRGYALDDQENEPGVNCIAFPIFLGSSQRPEGAISVSAVAQRTPLIQLVARADHARATITKHLGPVTSPPQAHIETELEAERH
jgi:IclR family acetate operon transcriptional repressor